MNISEAKAQGEQKVSGKGTDVVPMQFRERGEAKAGSDREKIRGELEGLKNFVGISGIFNMSPEDHNGLTPAAFVMVKIDKGGFQLID